MRNFIKWEQVHEKPEVSPKYPHDSVIRWFFKNFNLDKNNSEKILDVGCGMGRHSIFFSDNGVQSVACDNSLNAISYLNKIIYEYNLSINSVVMDADKIAFDNNSFDGVLCYGVLYYLTINKLIASAEEIYRVLKKNGRAFICLRSKEDSRYANSNKINENTAKIIGKGDEPWKYENEMEILFFTEDEVRKIFKEFSTIIIEKNIFTQCNSKYINSDFNIELIK